MQQAITERFWVKVDKGPGYGRGGDCWQWIGGRRDKKGYGAFGVSRAHRVSYEMHNGAIPVGMQVMHSCDNPACVNPSHLSLGTNQDNINDKLSKGRHINGNQKKTHCKRGHELILGNIIKNAPGEERRRCLLCKAERDKARGPRLDRNPNRIIKSRAS